MDYSVSEILISSSTKLIILILQPIHQETNAFIEVVHELLLNLRE